MALAATRELTALELELRPVVAEVREGAAGTDDAVARVLLPRAKRLAAEIDALIERIGQYLPPDLVDRATRLREDLAESNKQLMRDQR